MSEANGHELPTGWAAATLGDVTSETVAQSGPKRGAAFVYVDISSIDNRAKRIVEPKTLPFTKAPSRAKQNLRAKDVLVSMTRPNLNAVALVPKELDGAVGSTGFHVLRADQVEPSWLLHAVQTHGFILAMSRVVQGALYPAVRPKDIRTWTLPIPPLQEQRRIADKLDELFSDLDAGVAALERVQKKLAHYRAAVLKAAVEGALTADWRKKHRKVEPASTLLTRILAGRRRRWEQDQLRKFKAAGKEPPKDWKAKYKEPVAADTANLPPLPEGWCWASLDQVFRVERGRFSVRPRNDPRYYGGELPFVQIGDLPREGGAIRNYTQTLNSAGLAVSKKFPAGTVLIAIVGATIGNTGILTFDSCCPDSLVTLQSSSTTLLALAEFFLRSRKLFLRVEASASGGQPNINLEFLLPLAMPLPPMAEVEAIVEAVEDQLSVIEHIATGVEAKLKSAQSLRQSILRHAFTGQLVPQDPNDEPASELLKRIAAEREERARQTLAAKHAAKKPKRPCRTPAAPRKHKQIHGRIANR